MLLYHNLHELRRVVEVVEVTEEGIFVLDDLPASYGGAVLRLEVVHEIVFTDTSGRLTLHHMRNPVPLNKDKEPSSAPVLVDGTQLREGTGTPRKWITKHATGLDDGIKARAALVDAMRRSDGEGGSEL